MNSFWKKLARPILALAPMEDVTDSVFRQIVAVCARPTVFFTEFTSVDGLCSRGREEVIRRFEYTPGEHPIIAQIWGNRPELFSKAAKLIADMKFDGVDINAGCPQKNVTSRGAGACLIQDPPLMKEIIAATKEGAAQRALPGGGIPVSVKTRLGYKKISMDWISFLLEQDLDALTIHGRTVSELSRVPAHWDDIGRVVTLRNQMKKDTIIMGNGDVVDYADAAEKCNMYGTDGAMIGRGIFQNLWAFDTNGVTHMDDHKALMRIMREHMRLFEKTGKNFAILKKFFKIYIQGFPHAGDIRERLMEADTRQEAEEILRELTV